MMPQDTQPSSDPLFGNAASDLLRGAVGTDGKPPSDPRYWEPPTPEELQSRLSGYVIEAFLARGGMGAVYRGMQSSLERPVAIKILPPQLGEHDPAFLQRFKQEARAMAQLNHPGIVKVFDFGEMNDGTLYFIMEFIDGTDVGQMVALQGRLPSAHAMAITAHVCDALQYAHELGIVHRDIKPANIMVGIDGQVKVADFGLAKSFSSGQTSLTVTGHVMGTLHFVAPEALTLGSSVDHRADIYAMGVMLYQMLTGRLPQGIFEMPSLLVKGLDPRYDFIIASAMREDRNARYQSIREMRRALDGILTQPVVKSQATAHQQAAAAPPAHATAPKAHPDQHIFHPPHRARKKAGAVTWLLVTAVLLSLSGIIGMRMAAPPPDSISGAPLDKPFMNNLGMKFVPLPGTNVLMCQHETRRQDYEVYAQENPGTDNSWQAQKFNGWPSGHQDDHPVVGVNWNDAKAFCEWLSKKEGRMYRLPTDREWSQAAGIGKKETWNENEPPQARNGLVKEYTWGSHFPPTTAEMEGNYADTTYKERQPGESFIAGYTDGFSSTSPVMQFKANGFGFYDIGGNAREWIEDWWDEAKTKRVLRGSAWHSCFPAPMQTSSRHHQKEDLRDVDTGFRCVIEAPAKFPDAEFPTPVMLPPAPAVKPVALSAPISDPVFEKELGSYSWRMTGKDWVVYFQPEHSAVVREGNSYSPCYWWVIGPRKIHLQFSAQGPAFQSDTGEDWEVKNGMTQIVRISDGKLVCERDRSPPASAIGKETGFVTLLGDSGSEGWKYSGHPNGRVNQAYGIYSFKARSGEDEPGMFWYSKRTFSDFVLRIEFRLSEFKKNSGIYLRIPALKEGVQPLDYSQGCEIEIASHKTGIIPFTPQGNLRPPPLIVGDWNTYEITARGSDIEARLNGILTTRYTSTRGTAGHIGIQDFDDNMAIEFRNVRIKETASSTPAILTDKKPADYRTFTDTKGRTIRASLIRTQNDDVTLKTLDGKEHTFKAATLSATDITYLKTKGLVLPQAAFVLAPSILENVWKNRCNQTQRLETLYRAGGVPEAEVAVSAAFEYLKHKQNPDGSWGTLDRAGMTALALMAYVGRCETLESPFYGDNVMKGIMFLIETGKKNSTGLLCVDASSSHAAAEHGLATEALGQMYLTARYGSKSLPGMREAFEKGIRLIIESHPPGSDKARSSLSTLAWQCEALNTAKLAGLKFAGLDECIRHVTSTMRTLQNAEGGFVAQPPETPQAITGACLRTLQLFSDGGQAILDRGIRFARQHFQSTPLNYKKMDLYPVYFYTRAFYRKGGDDWRFWNRQMLPQVLSAQQPDGSFSTTPSTFMHGGDIENTALGVLTLETYYRDTPK